VRAVEAWSVLPTAATRPGEVPIVRTYPDRGHAAFNLVAVPRDTHLLARLPVAEGRWLRSDDRPENEVVFNQFARAQLPSLRVGRPISLTTEGKSTSFVVVGFVEDIGTPGPAAYVAQPTFARALGGAGPNQLRVAYTNRNAEPALGARIEDALEQAHARITAERPILELRSAVGDHMRVLISALLALAVLTGLIGALGLSSTMSINVMERTRELGVLRAIGATPSTIGKLVIAEGLTVGVLSLLSASLLSLPLSSAIGALIGRMAFRAPLALSVSTPGVISWALIVCVGATLATLYPALRASRLTTREALAYE
jgi:putative ABC transport system permease protein